MGGNMPSSFIEGFLTGLVHPLIGFDHFAFIVAIGLLAATQQRGLWVPIAFLFSAIMGTGLHVVGLTLPGTELLISGSILWFGSLLVIQKSSNPFVVMVLAAIAGVFHGYAYGESIVGAGMSPLLAYLMGFTIIQLLVSLSAYGMGKVLRHYQTTQKTFVSLRSAGLVICGIGTAFLMSQLVNILLPVRS
jgi:urease accessory protein